MKFSGKRFLMITGLVGALTLNLKAAEVDNYSMQDYVKQDVTTQMNAYINRAILEAIGKYNSNILGGKEYKEPEKSFVKLFYRNFEKTPLISFSRPWVERNLPYFPAQKEHLYKGMSLFGGPVLKVYGIVGNLTLNDLPVGLDKLGHFLDGGYALYKRVVFRKKTLEKALRWSVKTENSILGKTSTGVFSNADLVANFEGYMFYESMVRDDVVNNKQALVKFENGFAILTRSFDWRDHVNEYWNEAMAPSEFTNLLKRHVEEQLPNFCLLFEQRPELFYVSERISRKMDDRYDILGLRLVKENRLQNICF